MKKIIIVITLLAATVVGAAPVRSMVAARNAINIKSVSNGPSARDYIQDGLIAHWDGIENVGYGEHDSNSTIWKDLVGIRDATLAEFATFSADSLCAFNRDSSQKAAMAQTTGANRIEEPVGDEDYIMIEIGFRRNANYTVYGDGVSVFTPGSKSPSGYNSRFACIGAGNTKYNRLSLSGQVSTYKDFYTWEWTVRHTVTALYNKNFTGGGYYCSNNHNYIDGKHASFSGTDGSRLRIRSSGVSFGGNGSTEGLDGEVLFCRIYARELSAEEVAYNYSLDKVRFGL